MKTILKNIRYFDRIAKLTHLTCHLDLKRLYQWSAFWNGVSPYGMNSQIHLFHGSYGSFTGNTNTGITYWKRTDELNNLQRLNKINNKHTGLYGHLRIKDFKLISYQRRSYLHRSKSLKKIFKIVDQRNTPTKVAGSDQHSSCIL